jgi:hypothetical protein
MNSNSYKNQCYSLKNNIEQKIPKACLTPSKTIDLNLYNPAKIRKILEANNVQGVKQVYLPKKQGNTIAHASVIFHSIYERDNFIKKYINVKFALSPLETDKLVVTPWYTADQREQYKISQQLTKTRGFFCRDVPSSLTKEMLIEQLPNSEALTIIKIIFNQKNNNTMASFCYKSIEDARYFVTISKTGTFRLKVNNDIHDITVEPFIHKMKPNSENSEQETNEENNNQENEDLEKHMNEYNQSYTDENTKDM